MVRFVSICKNCDGSADLLIQDKFGAFSRRYASYHGARSALKRLRGCIPSDLVVWTQVRVH